MRSLIIIDNFYSDPHAVRELAIQTSYIDVRRLNYPGLQSDHSFYDQHIIKKFQEAIGEEIDNDVESFTFGKFRFMSEESGSRIKIHVDGLTEWTGLVYLNTPPQCEGGTSFYKHKTTGLEGPPPAEEMHRYGFASALDFERKIIERQSLDLNCWTETMFVGMKFNRLVLFRGNDLFHCHTHGFGTNRENSRLTQNFFFNTKNKSRIKTSIYREALK